MNANHWVKSVLHFLAAFMTLVFSTHTIGHNPLIGTLMLVAGLLMVLLVFFHRFISSRLSIRTRICLFAESVALGLVAWKLYQQGYHKATFLYEGVSIFYLSIAAFLFLLQKKRDVLFSEEDLKS